MYYFDAEIVTSVNCAASYHSVCYSVPFCASVSAQTTTWTGANKGHKEKCETVDLLVCSVIVFFKYKDSREAFIVSACRERVQRKTARAYGD